MYYGQNPTPERRAGGLRRTNSLPRTPVHVVMALMVARFVNASTLSADLEYGWLCSLLGFHV